MKRFKFLILPITAAAVMLSACGEEPVNQGPELRGISDITCFVNTSVDLLEGVAALDTEDGDITPELKITVIPEVKVENGYAVFSQVGDYEICYEVYDSLGKLARTTAFASVIERDVYIEDVCASGFSVSTGGSTELISKGLNGNAYSFKTVGQEIAEDVRLSRTFTLAYGTAYTFKYDLNVNRAGRIRAAADGVQISDISITEGKNILTFVYELPQKEIAEGSAETENVNIELWFGSLEGELECSLSKAELNYYQNEDGYNECLPDFDFRGKIENRDGKAQAVYASEDGKSATVEITQPTGEIWQVGMFVNTGLELVSGETYYISFKMESALGNGYEICIQHDQWKDSDAIIINTPPNGVVERTVTADDSWRGQLWLFIRSGVNANKLTVSDFSVKTKRGGNKTESFPVNGFTNNNSNGGDGRISTEYGKLIYEVKNFGNDWGNNEVQSPEFALSGNGDNYVVEFKAKASKSLNFVFLIHDERASEWKTVAWKSLRMTEGEAVYSINCDKANIDSVYKIFWQFGNSANAGNHDVTIEISDIKICLKNEMLEK